MSRGKVKVLHVVPYERKLEHAQGVRCRIESQKTALIEQCGAIIGLLSTDADPRVFARMLQEAVR
jgi:hypothetical protein